MLLDRERRLLTAYVDGELSSRQRRYVVRLLHRSAEARQLLQQLKADARALRQLPRPSLPIDFTEPVLRTIAERNLSAGQCRIVKAASVTVWIGPLVSWAAAAAVLLALGVASYFYFAASLEQPAQTEIAQQQSGPPPLTPQSQELGPPIIKEDETQTASRERPAPKNDPSAPAEPPKVVQHRRNQPKSSPAEKPSPPKEETVLAERSEMFSLERVPDLLPVVVKVSDLVHPPSRKKLIDELRKDDAFHLELPCLNGSKAFDRVQNAARTLHIGLLIDKQAQERIKLRWRANYGLYIENITPEELTQFVQQIGMEDRKSAAGKKNAETQIDYLVLTRLTAGQRKELATLLGMDPPTASKTTEPLGADPHHPLSDTTARQVGRALAGQGGALRPESGKPEGQPPQPIALVLTYNPIRPSPGSEEIKQFLEGRRPIRTGALRVLLVLRSS
jgi:hypothetical protein